MFTPGEILCFKKGKLGGTGYFDRLKSEEGLSDEDVHVTFITGSQSSSESISIVEHMGRKQEIFTRRLQRLEFLPYDPNQQPFNEGDI